MADTNDRGADNAGTDEAATASVPAEHIALSQSLVDLLVSLRAACERLKKIDLNAFDVATNNNLAELFSDGRKMLSTADRLLQSFSPVVQAALNNANEEARDMLPNLAGVRVLVAEDSASQRLLVEKMLARLGATVVTTDDGIEAVQQLRASAFDLLVIDIEMPRKNGIEVIRELRAMQEPTRSTPVLAFTAYAAKSNQDTILQAGADGVLQKPVGSLGEFGSAITRILSPGAHRPLQVMGAEGSSDPETGRLAGLIEMAGPDAAQELVHRLYDDLRSVEHGLVLSLAGPDWEGIRKETHVLVAVAGAIGASELQALAEALNAVAHEQVDTEVLPLGMTLLSRLDRLIAAIGKHPLRLKAAS